MRFDRKRALELIMRRSHYYTAYKHGDKFEGEEALENRGIDFKKLGNVCCHAHPAGLNEGHVLLISIPAIRVPIGDLVQDGTLVPVHHEDIAQ